MSELQNLSSQVVDQSEALSQEIREFEKVVSKLHIPFPVTVQIGPGEHVKWMAETCEIGYYKEVRDVHAASACNNIVKRKVIDSFNDILEAISKRYKQHLSEGKSHVKTVNKAEPKQVVESTIREQPDRQKLNGIVQKPTRPSPSKKPRRRPASKGSNDRVKKDTAPA